MNIRSVQRGAAARGEGQAGPARGRRGPSPAKTARTRAEIVAAALGLFTERGFAETRMADVAERARVAKGTLYLYYPDKEALFEGVLTDAIGAPAAALAALRPEAGEGTRAFLARTLVPLLRGLEDTGRAAVLRLVVAESARFPALAAIYGRLVVEPVLGLARELCAAAVARGELRSDALARVPLLLIAPGIAVTVWNGLFGAERPMNAGEVFEAYLDLLFGPEPPRGG